MLNRISLLFALVATLFAFGCDDLTSVDFTLRGAQVSFTVEETDQPATITFTQTDIPTNIQAELDANDVDADRISSIKPKTATFTITGGATVDFGILDRAELRISGPGLAPVVLSDTDLTAVSDREVMLTVSDVELLDYLRGTSIDYVLEITTNAPVEEAFELNVRVDFEVRANVI